MRVSAQHVDDINFVVQRLINRDIKTIVPHHQDSIKVNEYLKNITRCIATRNDSALIYANHAIILAEKAGLVKKISVALQELGQYFMTKEDFADAISCFINALKIEEKLNDERRVADLNDELARVYYYQEIFAKALEYHEKAIVIYQNLKDTINIAKVLSHIGSLHLSREYCEQRSPEQIQSDCKIAIDYFDQSIILCEKKGNLDGVANGYDGISAVYNRMNKPEIAIDYIGKALTFYQKNRNTEKISNALYSMGLIYNRLQKYDQALRCFNESNEIALQEKYTDGIQFLYGQIAQTHVNLKDYKNAYNYYLKYMIIRDSVYNKEKSQQIFELETKYQTEKKQDEIKNLTLVKRQRTLVIYILIASLLLGFLVSWMYFRNIRNKKIIADQKLEIKEKQLLELEKERQLVAAKSVLQGEEAERARLAGDLHDGLGGLLSGVKLKLSFMKENAIITSENLVHFNHALDLLDDSITEMRRVAHNLMPETLMHYGLRTALNDFINQVAPGGSPLIRFNTFGEDLRFDKELEITVYRVTQELATNSIKHAHAKQIDIQLFTEKDRVCIQVIDNGIGFEPEKPDTTKKGHGLKNINDRVTAFNGRCEILSQPGKGTESTIEFLIS
jgi:signal transduction histidine kinase